MKASSFLLGLLAPAAMAIECGNEDYNHDPLGITPTQYRRALTDLRERDITTVNMIIHVLVAENPTEDYGPKIDSQIAYLNSHYQKWGYQFDLTFTQYVIDADWASEIDTDKDAKMNALHMGDYQTLNVYLVQNGTSGVCSLPQSGTDGISQSKLNSDGCFVPLSVGLSATSGTLAHEIGHWFGLLHVFQGGCTGDGDYCDDTAPQAAASYAHESVTGDLGSCPAKESCSAGTFDNVKNFMDYTDCAQEFTPCQGGRMNVAWSYRLNRALASGVQVSWP